MPKAAEVKVKKGKAGGAKAKSLSESAVSTWLGEELRIHRIQVMVQLQGNGQFANQFEIRGTDEKGVVHTSQGGFATPPDVLFNVVAAIRRSYPALPFFQF